MGRRYGVDTFRRRLAPLADFNLTTDVIVGFPGEDEPAFAATLSTVAAVGFTKVHVFPYSPRPGTRTAVRRPGAARRQEGAERSNASRFRCRFESPLADACG